MNTQQPKTIANLAPKHYFCALLVTMVSVSLGVFPSNMLGSLAFLILLGEGLFFVGNRIPIVRTYLGGSVFCFLGGAVLVSFHIIPTHVIPPIDVFVNDSGFLTLYVASLIAGSLFNIDRKLLLHASIKLLPVACFSIAAGFLVCGVIGAVSGGGVLHSLLFIAIPMTAGGVTAGTIPLSSIYAAVLGLPQADLLNLMLPATVMGNCFAIVCAGILKNIGTKHPTWTGDGVLVDDGNIVPTPPITPLTVEKLSAGLLLTGIFYVSGQLLHGFVPIIPTYAWMIAAVMTVKCLSLLPDSAEDCLRQWGRFSIKAFTAAALFGIGVTTIDLNQLLKSFTPMFLLTVLLIELTIAITAAVVGRKVGFFPVESAITAGLCTTNMGGSGNVAVLIGSNRMALLPFAQIVTRSCGALILTLGGIIIHLAG